MNNNKFKKILTMISILMIFTTILSTAFAHSGRTDGSGGHNDNNNASGLGSYHYHHGYSAHLHPNGICPYAISTSKTSSVSNTGSAAIVDSSEIIVMIPEFDVRVNGVLIDTTHSQYPVIFYKNITYFPMTSDYLTGIGLGLKFSSADGLIIDMKDQVGSFEQKFLGASNILGSKNKAKLASFNVEVNGKTINNDEEEYPVLLYKNITYFPMTWRFAVTEFGWKTKWSNETGFGITIEK